MKKIKFLVIIHFAFYTLNGIQQLDIGMRVVGNGEWLHDRLIKTFTESFFGFMKEIRALNHLLIVYFKTFAYNSFLFPNEALDSS